MSDSNYLTPGVYIRELEGPAPIVGVSTSITAFVGMAERGPVNVPILCTSPGDYTRWFGGLLDYDEFADVNDSRRSHCYLPYAVAGFFNNSGQIAYVIRVLPEEANAANDFLYDRTGSSAVTSALVRSAGVGDGTGATLATGALVALSPVPAVGDSIRIGDGSVSEYMTIAAAAAITEAAPLDLPLQLSHAQAASVAIYPQAAAVAACTLDADAMPGDTTIHVNSAVALPAANAFILGLDRGDLMEVRVPIEVTGTAPDFIVKVTEPLTHAFPGASTTVRPLNNGPAPANTLELAASGGDMIAYVAGGGLTVGALIDFDPGTPAAREVRTIGKLTQLSFATPATEAWPAKTEIVPVTLAAAPAPAVATTITALTRAGARVVSLASRAGVAQGTILRLDVGLAQEYAVVAAVQGARAQTGPDPGSVTLESPLAGQHPSGVAAVPLVTGPPPAGDRTAQILLDVAPGDGTALVTVAGVNSGDLVQINFADGSSVFNTISAAPTAESLDALQLSGPVLRTHAVGSPIVARNPLIQVRALDAGAWGQRLALSVADESPGLVSRSQVVTQVGPTQLQLSSLTGIQRGSYLELLFPDGTIVDAAAPLKVAAINLANATITLDAAVSPAQAAAIGASTPTTRIGLRSREFRITVFLYRHPDPAVPSRDTQVIQTELFRNLSMDPRHSQYFVTVIGDMNGPPRLSDGRPDGSSWLIRVADTAMTDAARQAPRLGPEALIDILPNGLQSPAQHRLEHDGDDSLATMDDLVYCGTDAVEPADRTGIFALQNIQQVSLVAVPGQGTPLIQAALIDFCETSRFCFAILDPQYPDFAIADIQAQRQSFDTKYAAIYYPWLTIPDPMPTSLATIGTFALPPSGHVAGVFARVDVARGVFKAPANEVVAGITGLSRTLMQGDQDVLNPAPNNINVIRDFRPQGRGIRIWGARVITSDDNYKYVPVRRLLIFIEQSIMLGLQDVVFEPNGPVLWASVERVISNFLTDVWASGGLQGATPDQSFFVRCDDTTMSQSEIDAGILKALIGVAPIMPAEFVVIEISLITAATSQ